MPYLKERLGNAGCDRIRAATKVLPQRKTTRGFHNPLLEKLQEVCINTSGISDILNGVAHCFGRNKPLNALRIITILQCLEYIDTRNVMIVTDLSERSCRDYVRACRMALPHLQKYFRTGCSEQRLPDYQ